MIISLDQNRQKYAESEAKILTAFARPNKEDSLEKSKAKATQSKAKLPKRVDTATPSQAVIDHWDDKGLKEEFYNLKSSSHFKGYKDETLTFTGSMGELVKVVGLGEKNKVTAEDIRKTTARLFKQVKAEKVETISFDFKGFDVLKDTALVARVMIEAIEMSHYSFDKYFSKKSPSSLSAVYLSGFESKKQKMIEAELAKVLNVTNSIHIMRDFINEVPNVLHSEEYAKRIQADCKKNLKGVKVKILNKAQIKAEKMNLFLSVNAGSAYEPRLVHLTYEPKGSRANKEIPHVALVGKGITFDTGGYSLKPGPSMAGMKNDMGGSATMYAVFRAAVLLKAPVKLSCILALTDNAVNSGATFPDAVVTGRNGKTVEILNTDAEGRLILADALDYACDLKPSAIIDAATLTGACLVALGNQVAAILGNNQKWMDKILSAAKEHDEYMWQLPIIPEWRSDIKSKVADLKNIGTPMRAGTAIGAAFLQEFIQGDIPWAHLDIAGIVDAQSHLPYCPPQGASGLLVRSLSYLLAEMKTTG
jgi:leucyl aminopeptidase